MSISRKSYCLDELLQDGIGQGLDIEFCSKELTLGPKSLQQYWLARASIYGTRRRNAVNQSVILDYFHRCVIRHNDSQIIESASETHLLASLAAHIRSTGAQRILPDASLKSSSNSLAGFQAVDELNKQLSLAIGHQITAFEFYEHSRSILEFPDVSEEVKTLYEELQSDLFAGTSRIWPTHPHKTAQLVIERWKELQRRFGRRSGNEQMKQVLDILSYESKAALHQCYSHLWEHLSVTFAKMESCQDVAYFHRLWNCDFRIPTQDVQDMHLLHGHVFGLHPAFGRMIQTKTGSRIIGQAIGTAFDSPAMERFFAAGLLSLNSYMSERIEQSSR